MTGFVSNSILEQIRSTSDIVEIIEEYVPLKKSGKNFLGLCPFHSEKTPSFSVSPEKQIYHCFGCGEGGNVFSFLMKFSNFSFPEAVTHLGKRYGIAVPTEVHGSMGKYLYSSEANKKEKYFTLNWLAAEYFHQNLFKGCGKSAQDYLQKRNISSDTIKKFQIGYANKDWDLLLKHFRKKNVNFKDLKKIGLVILRESGTGCYDRFRDRIIFPIIGLDNKIRGFGGRDISHNEKIPKYINSPESFIYNKSEILFGYNIAKESIRKKGFVIIVEGYFDLISLYQHGFENVLATCGTALTTKQAGLIKRYTNNVLLLFDSDESGHKAATRGFEVLLEYGLNIKVVDLPENTDPDTFINQFGLAQLNEKINKSELFIEYLANKIVGKVNLNSLEEKLRGLSTLMPYLAKIKNSIERSEYIRKISELFQVSQQSLQYQLKKKCETKKTKIDSKIEMKIEKKVSDWSERNLVRLIILHPENIEKVKRKIDSDHFTDNILKEAVEFIFGMNIPKEHLSPQKIVELIPIEKVRKIVTELLMETIEFDKPDKVLEDCIQSIFKKAKQKDVENLIKQRIEAVNSKKVAEFQKLDKDLKDLQGV